MAADKEATYTGKEIPCCMAADKEATYNWKEMPYIGNIQGSHLHWE